MAARRRHCNSFLFFIFLPILACAPYPIYTHAAHAEDSNKTVPQKPVEHVPEKHSQSIRDIPPPDSENFARLADTFGTDTASKAGVPPHEALPYMISSRYIRVALRQNVTKARFLSAGQIDILGGASGISVRGDLTVEISKAGERLTFENKANGKWECALPCTLLSKNELNIIDYNGAGYRGSMILFAERPGCFTVVNFTLVEDYLRGVVPLEIGHCRPEEAEAVKAQAIAARTYTYKKVIEKHDQGFDLFPTISDQVYGGVAAENPLCNEAILATADRVMVCHDSLIYAYYHSTCGGKTANIEDVWENKQPVSYLRSVDDVDEHGAAFCGFSASYSWEDAWPRSTLSSIVNKYSREVFPQNAATGAIKELAVDSRFSCGRARLLAVKTSSGTFRYGGDKIRFILRRNKSGFPILRSALITGASASSGSIVVKGRGYGHGVGMCQYGAIGRARAGQSCEHILKAYYTGVELRKIEVARK